MASEQIKAYKAALRFIHSVSRTRGANFTEAGESGDPLCPDPDMPGEWEFIGRYENQSGCWCVWFGGTPPGMYIHECESSP